MGRCKKGELPKRSLYKHVWTESEDEKLKELNEKGTCMPHLVRALKIGGDEILFRLKVLGINRVKVSIIDQVMEKHRKEERERRFKERIAPFKAALPESDRRRSVLEEAQAQHAAYKSMKRKQEEERFGKKPEDFFVPQEERTDAFYMQECAGRCCKRKEQCKHYESYLQHGGGNAPWHSNMVFSSSCIGQNQFHSFVPVSGVSYDDVPVFSESV